MLEVPPGIPCLCVLPKERIVWRGNKALTIWTNRDVPGEAGGKPGTHCGSGRHAGESPSHLGCLGLRWRVEKSREGGRYTGLPPLEDCWGGASGVRWFPNTKAWWEFDFLLGIHCCVVAEPAAQVLQLTGHCPIHLQPPVHLPTHNMSLLSLLLLLLRLAFLYAPALSNQESLSQ